MCTFVDTKKLEVYFNSTHSQLALSELYDEIDARQRGAIGDAFSDVFGTL